MPTASPYAPHIRAAAAVCMRTHVAFGHLDLEDLLQNLWILDVELRPTHDGRLPYEKYFIQVAVRRAWAWSLQTLGLRNRQAKAKPVALKDDKTTPPDDSLEIKDAAGNVLGQLSPNVAWACVTHSRGIWPRHGDQAMGWKPGRAFIHRQNARKKFLKAGKEQAA